MTSLVERLGLSSLGGDIVTEEREEARLRVFIFFAREGIHITMTTEAYELHAQTFGGEVARRRGQTSTRWR